MSALKQNNGFTRQNSSRVSEGFTIIELILFLALTGLFLLIALNGITGRADNARFTDSMRSLEGFMRRQTNDIFTGVNSTGSGSSGDEIILGFITRFNLNSDVVEVHKIKGARLPTWDSKPRRAIYDSVKALPATESIVYETSTYNLKWGNQFIHGQRAGGAFYTAVKDQTNNWGLLRDPNGTALIPIFLMNSTPFMPGQDLNDPETYNPDADHYEANGSVHACFRGANGRIGELIFAEGTANYNFEVAFEPFEKLPCKNF